MEDAKDSRAQAYATDRALKKYDATKRLLPSRHSAWEVREYNRARSGRLQRDKVPPRDVDEGADDEYDVDVQRELLDEWAQRAREKRDGSPARPPADAPVENFVVGTIKTRTTSHQGYEVVRGSGGVISLEEDAERAPEPHEEWEHVEKGADERPTTVLSYAAILQR